MAQYTRELFQPNNFNLAFEQMCNFAAIANTRNADETLKQLIMQCFVVFPRERFHNAAQLADAIMAFGLQIPEYQVQVSLLNNQRIPTWFYLMARVHSLSSALMKQRPLRKV